MPSLFGEEFDIKIKQPDIKKISTKLKSQPATGIAADKVLKSKKLSLSERLAVIKTNVYRILGKQIPNVVVIKNNTDFDKYMQAAIASGYVAVDTETDNSLDPVTCKLMGLCLYYPGGKQAYIPVNHTDVSRNRLTWQCTESDCRQQLERLLYNKNAWSSDFDGQGYSDWFKAHPEITGKAPVIIMHNGKFDYEVLKCTCGIEVVPDWDTMVAARLLNENEPAGLKWQYINKIDPSQAKYDIENLFEHIQYQYVDPEVFALYAATDSYMTYKLFELQDVELEKDEYGPHKDLSGLHMVPGLRWLFHKEEMPIVHVTAEMELAGVQVDEELGERLKVKYDKLLESIDSEINTTISGIKSIFDTWLLSEDATHVVRTYAPKKTKSTQESLIAHYPFVDEQGRRYKESKAKKDLLTDPINLASPVQLGILFYDILNIDGFTTAERIREAVNKTPAELWSAEDKKKRDASIYRNTGKDELKAIKERFAGYLPKLDELWIEEEDLGEEAEEAVEVSTEKQDILRFGTAATLANLILKRRGITKLITTYIDVIPSLAKHWPDGRIRFHLNSLGTDTGRYSSGGKIKYFENGEPVSVSGINIQNIPSRGDGAVCRLLFKAATNNHIVELADDYYTVPETDEVETPNGWVLVSNLKIGDKIIGEQQTETIQQIVRGGNSYKLYVE